MILSIRPARLALFVSLTLVLGALAFPQSTLRIDGATVLPMTAAGAVLDGHSVLVEGGTIAWIGPREEAPDAERVVDAAGRYLLPGLIDAHVHLFDENQLALYPANGVTGVFNLSGAPFALEWELRVLAGELVGPRIFSTGPQVKESATPAVDTEVTLPAADEIEAFVRMHEEQGYGFLKVWSSIAPYAYENILAECRRQGVRVTGHVPSRVGLRGALASGQRSFAHVEELLNKFFLRDLDPDGLRAVRTIGEAEDFTVISTLVTYEMIADVVDDERLAARMARSENRYLDPMLLELWGSDQDDWRKLRRTERAQAGYYDEALEFMLLITRELHAAGVPVLAGSDSGIVVSNIVPGWSLHRELELLQRAGLSADEVLLSATARPGSFLAPGSGLGTIAVGAPADLVVLDGDPREAIGNTRRVFGVATRGTWRGRAELEDEFARIEILQAGARGFFAAWRESPEDPRAIEGRSLPGEASFLIAAYQRAAAGDLEASVALGQLSSRLHPGSYRSPYFLSGVYEMMGRVPEARAALRSVEALRPDHSLLPSRWKILGR